MLSKTDILIWNLIAFVGFAAVLYMQYEEGVALVDKFTQIFGIK